MDISAISHASHGVDKKPNLSLGGDIELDCELVFEDAKGHHTFNANPELTKVILSFLVAL